VRSQTGVINNVHKAAGMPTDLLDVREPCRCICIYSLCNNAFSTSDYIVSNDRMIGNNELERTWKEAVMA
jgi:hypothetical protein